MAATLGSASSSSSSSSSRSVGDVRWPSSANDYEFIKRLGNKSTHAIQMKFYGCNGAVYLCRVKPSFIPSMITNGIARTAAEAEIAIKIVYNYDDLNSSRDLMFKYQNEMNLCCGPNAPLVHPNIACVYTYFIDTVPSSLPDWDATEASARSFFIVMEYYPFSLQNVLSHRRSFISEGSLLKENEIWLILRDISAALCHLRSNLVAHRDLKPDNILFRVGDKHNLLSNIPQSGVEVVVADMGESTDFKVYKNEAMHLPLLHGLSRGGSLYYLAPEITRPPGEAKYLDYDKSDVWSLGAVLAEMISFVPPPLFDSSTKTLLPSVLMSSLAGLSCLLTNMIEVNPIKRWSIQQVWSSCMIANEMNRSYQQSLLQLESRLPIDSKDTLPISVSRVITPTNIHPSKPIERDTKISYPDDHRRMLYMIGGILHNSLIKNIRIDPFNNYTNEPFISMATVRCEAGHVRVNDRIYVTGGIDPDINKTLGSIEVYDIKSNKWMLLPGEMKYGRYHHVSVSTHNGNRIWCIGGSDGQGQKSVEYYDVAADRWFDGPHLPDRRYCHCGVTIGDIIYIFGDQHVSLMLNTSVPSASRTESLKWKVIASTIKQRDFARAVVINDDCILIMGGHDPNDRIRLDSIECYSPSTNTMRMLSWKLPLPLHSFSVWYNSTNKVLCIAGGYFPLNYDVYIGVVDKVDLSIMKWSKASKLSQTDVLAESAVLPPFRIVYLGEDEKTDLSTVICVNFPMESSAVRCMDKIYITTRSESLQTGNSSRIPYQPKSILCYNMKMDSWSVLPGDMTINVDTNRRMLSTHGGTRIWIFGTNHTMAYYDLTVGKWFDTPSCPILFQHASCEVGIGNCIYVFGNPSSTPAASWMMNTTPPASFFTPTPTMKWKSITPLSCIRHHARAVAIDHDHILILGGNETRPNKFKVWDLVELYESSTNTMRMLRWKLPLPLHSFAVWYKPTNKLLCIAGGRTEFDVDNDKIYYTTLSTNIIDASSLDWKVSTQRLEPPLGYLHSFV